jgi:hypothetical protein
MEQTEQQTLEVVVEQQFQLQLPQETVEHQVVAVQV